LKRGWIAVTELTAPQLEGTLLAGGGWQRRARARLGILQG